MNFKTYTYKGCETCENGTFCKTMGTGKHHTNKVFVGVFLEGLFDAVYSRNYASRPYEDKVRWFTVNKSETALLDKLKVNHIYNITVDEYSSFIGDDGSVCEGNHEVTHKCKVLRITSDSNKAIRPCDITIGHISKVEEIVSRYFDYEKSPKIQKREM